MLNKGSSYQNSRRTQFCTETELISLLYIAYRRDFVYKHYEKYIPFMLKIINCSVLNDRVSKIKSVTLECLWTA